MRGIVPPVMFCQSPASGVLRVYFMPARVAFCTSATAKLASAPDTVKATGTMLTVPPDAGFEALLAEEAEA